MKMTSSRPYLVRAVYQWIVDNGLTPHLLVDATIAGVFVPPANIDEGKIILNIGPMAITALVMSDDEIAFNARFSGKPMNISVPINAIMAVYAKENGQGRLFGSSDDVADKNLDKSGEPDDEPPHPSSPRKAKRPTLKIVK